MERTDHLKDIIQQQKAVLTALEAEQRLLESSNLVKENSKLQAEHERLCADYDKVCSHADALSDENTRLKNALYEQIYNEKVKIVNTTAQKMDTYFRLSLKAETDQLTKLEQDVSARIKAMREKLLQNHVELQDDLYARLDELSNLLNTKLTEARGKNEKLSGAFTTAEVEELEALKAEPLTDAQIQVVAKQNNLERFVGLKVLNVLGVLLLLAGAIALSKGITMFLLGGAMLVLGEIMNTRKPNIFSLGMTAGGVGVLYAALATSYFSLGLLNAVAAIIVCALITANAFLLSTRYNAQIIAIFALTGGYLPMFSIVSNTKSALIYGAMLYFIALNLLALLISFAKKWYQASFIGLVLNIFGTFTISTIYFNTQSTFQIMLIILYILFAFLIYTAIPLVSTYKAGLKFVKYDVMLLGINTVFSSLIMYKAFYRFGLSDYDGMLTIVFAVIYLLLGRFVEKKFAGQEQNTTELFYLTGLAFVVLAIPMQLGIKWLSMGWLIEGLVLALFGIVKEHKSFREKGFIICALCLMAFILFDVPLMFQSMFTYKYAAITLGSVSILGAYMYKRMMAQRFINVYKYVTLTNIWIFTLYIIGISTAPLYDTILFNTGYLTVAASVVASFVIAYVFPRISLLADRGTKILSAVIYVISILWITVLNIYQSPVPYSYLRTNTPAWSVTIIATVILLVLGILSVLAIRDLTKIVVVEHKLGVEWFPIIISGYSVIILTQNLIVHYNLSFSSVVISIIYVIAAFAWIIFGFVRRFSAVRRFGLGLSILAVIKLFLVDLFSVTKGYRILSYFALGITLIAISFVYQYFSTRLELKGVEIADAKEDI